MILCFLGSVVLTVVSFKGQPVEILSKTAKRMHTVAEYLGMAVTRLSLATMVSGFSGCSSCFDHGSCFDNDEFLFFLILLLISS